MAKVHVQLSPKEIEKMRESFRKMILDSVRVGEKFKEIQTVVGGINERLRLATTPEEQLDYMEREDKRNNRLKAQIAHERHLGLAFNKALFARTWRELYGD